MTNVPRETEDVKGQIRQFARGCADLGITLNAEQRKKFSEYLEELFNWNRRINLVSRRETENIALHHFLDSLSLLLCVEIPLESKVVDIGTGAGFPGLPLKICRPDLLLTLVESTKKKSLFLRHTVKNLGLQEVKVLCDRAERLSQDTSHMHTYDIGLSRAVTRLRPLVAMGLPFIKPGGRFISYKGGDIGEELEETVRELPGLSGRLERRVDIILPISKRKRQLIIFKKIN